MHECNGYYYDGGVLLGKPIILHRTVYFARRPTSKRFVNDIVIVYLLKRGRMFFCGKIARIVVTAKGSPADAARTLQPITALISDIERGNSRDRTYGEKKKKKTRVKGPAKTSSIIIVISSDPNDFRIITSGEKVTRTRRTAIMQCLNLD